MRPEPRIKNRESGIKNYISHFTFHVLWIFLLTVPVVAQSTGPTVSGHVTNGTPAGVLPTGAAVSLRFFVESDWTSIYTTSLAADGTFAFDGLETEQGHDFVTRIRYQDVDYFSAPALLSGVALTTEIRIYETTVDASGIQIDQLHLFIAPTPERVFVVEYYMIGNTGDRAYMGDLTDGNHVSTPLKFTLPSDAENITLEGGELGDRYLGTPDSFVDTRAVPPGTATSEVRFSYELPYQPGLTLARVLDVPIVSVVVIVSSEDIGIEGPSLVFNGLMDTQMGPAASYTAGSLRAAQPLSVTFVPQTVTRPSPDTHSSTTSTPQLRAPRHPANELGLGLMVLVASGVISYWLWQPSPLRLMPASARPLVAQIVTLDMQLANGDISEENHQRERANIKQKVRQIIQSTE